MYSQVWKDYAEGRTQIEIREILEKKGEKVRKNALSNFLRDPFYAGINCYGNLVVDMFVDSKFEPMVPPKEFLKIQKMDRDNPRGWRVSEDFRPFNNFVICSDCSKPMTAGVSKGKSDRYLSVTCGHSKCKETRRAKGITPIANTIRGVVILDFVIDFLENSLKIDKKTYNKAKEKYLEGRNSLVRENRDQIKLWKSKVSKLQSKKKKLTERIFNENNKNVADKLSNDCSIIINQIRGLEKRINEYKIKNKDYEAEVELDFPSYDVF